MNSFLRILKGVSGALCTAGMAACAMIVLCRPRLRTLCSVSCAGRELTTLYSARRRKPPRALAISSAGCALIFLLCAFLHCKKA